MQTLRKARVADTTIASRLVVISEDGFLKGLGLESHRQTLSPLYSTTTLTELLGVSRERVMAWVKAGLIKPAATEHGGGTLISARSPRPKRSASCALAA